MLGCRVVHVEASTEGPLRTGADTIAAGVLDGEAPSGELAQPVAGLLESGEARTQLAHVALTHLDGRRIIVVGLGEPGRFGPEAARHAAAAVERRAAELSSRVLCWQLPSQAGEQTAAERAAALIEGTLLSSYRFARYLPPRDDPLLERLIISFSSDLSARARATELIVAAQNRARDLGNTPGNDLPPAALAGYARELATRCSGVTVEVLCEEQIREMGMGAFAAVAQGSAQEARLIQIAYEGPGAEQAPRIALIGKAITFDAGGISLKPNTSMQEMKFDMAGGAAVLESVAALSELRAPVRILGLVGAAENLPGGRAVKPGDIVRALDGTTIEVDNTDAEGRLVLADCMCYARAHGADRMIDIATLTGAVVTALGSFHAGLFANDDDWAALISQSAERCGERVWRLPLGDPYAKMIRGRYAQLTNRALRREAQAITAAELLHHFSGGLPWAHLDIAGTAYDVPLPYLRGKGATGFGVRLLVEVALAAARRGLSAGSPPAE